MIFDHYPYRNELDKEREDRKNEGDRLERALDDQAKKGDSTSDELRALINKERDDRTKESKDMDNYFRYN